MAAEDPSQDDRTEEASQERRDDFRERGQIAHSRELSSILVLCAAVAVMIYGMPAFSRSIFKFLTSRLQSATSFKISSGNVLNYLFEVWLEFLTLILPVFLAAAVVGTFSVLFQTRFNFSWKRLSPDPSKMNPLSGIARMFSFQAAFELAKSVAKTCAVGGVAFLILQSEWLKVPSLMMVPMQATWNYWANITRQLVWSTSALLFALGAADFFYNWISLERKMKMTKQEVKEEYKRRELDPMIKARMRRMQREIVTKKTLEKTKKATVIITNPTHYSIAVQYELGMPAPKVLAKGIDFLALRMREVAKGANIPIVENPPLARTLYKVVEDGQEIPDTLYKAVSEVIRYVFQLKGIKINKSTANVKG